MEFSVKGSNSFPHLLVRTYINTHKQKHNKDKDDLINKNPKFCHRSDLKRKFIFI